jgi:hypothetical protein
MPMTMTHNNAVVLKSISADGISANQNMMFLSPDIDLLIRCLLAACESILLPRNVFI